MVSEPSKLGRRVFGRVRLAYPSIDRCYVRQDNAHRGGSLGSSRLETRLPHLNAGGTRSSDDVRSAVMSGKRNDEIGPALIEHRLIADGAC